eukprot:scaffold31035_cov22-Cyclotella_meneghiniana.AAC.1
MLFDRGSALILATAKHLKCLQRYAWQYNEENKRLTEEASAVSVAVWQHSSPLTEGAAHFVG